MHPGANEKAGCPGSPMWFHLEAFHSLHGFSQLSLKWGWHSAHPQICNICQTGNTSWNRSHSISSNKTTEGRSDTGNNYTIHPLLFCLENTGSLYVADKQTVTRQGGCLGNISNTYVGAQTCRGAEGFHMNEWLKRGAWEKQSTYSHNRTPFSSADRKSLLPNFFLVTAWKKKKKDRKTVSKIARGVGWGEEAGVCVRVVGWGGWRRKVGCWEQ